MAVAAGDEFFVVGSEDGTVSLYSLETNTFKRFLTRTVLPIRDVALTNDRQWCAVASDELSVKIVNTKDITQVKHLREHARAVRNVSFDPQGRLVALSGTDGIVYVYSLTAEEPELIRKVDGIIGAIDGDSETSTRVAWHPDGRAFAVPTPVRDIQIISKNDWEKQRTFANGHLADITAIAWSPNGAMLASASKDGKVLIWETKTQSVIARYDYSNVIDIVWHPTKNILSFTTTDGEVYIYPDFLTDQFSPLLKLATQPAPFIHDPLAELSANRRPPPVNGQKQQGLPTRPRRESLGSLDSFLEGGDGYGDDDFVEDDDGAGYTIGTRPETSSGCANYVRVYTLFGMPYRVYRPKSTPMVTCASWRDYVLTMGNGPMGADGNTRLLYTIENVKRDEICQNEDTVALPEGATLKSVFFSDNGPSRASWVPLLDTKLLDRLASGRKNESYFPIAVADNKFHCIILKGGDQYPYFPRPLLSEFEFSIPISSAPKTSKRKAREGSEDLDMADGDEDKDEDEDGSSETRKLEQQFMLHNVKAAQLRDLVEATSSSHTQRSQLSRLELEIDKTLLQLLAVECREGEERGMRALEMVQLMRDRTGRMMEAAGRVAERYGRTILGEKIREVGEKRIEGLEDDDFP
ncbi:chromosome transmission fidelity protein 4 [Fusarium oxysporum f. sp. lycopersici 4287]|uniref:Chromosome transmission fidelity protein 4 n=1 Tax=Fusarium oxysporum f. sp. lycopersici (strain 4287 / CBS 123668 / FGSC 9935 / NRRL 34936) TaxID=426428 RepID=A0A0J9VQY3_FUSO4|nr:chromosome transmission fidelity protein 4 [Fusarium oxysporum f. sp. lycopersici 4287]KNB13211.1 chromosome transmission fidelity protein 4 [Fusarium oxysporum f. sp. lycopersici 4287]